MIETWFALINSTLESEINKNIFFLLELFLKRLNIHNFVKAKVTEWHILDTNAGKQLS